MTAQEMIKRLSKTNNIRNVVFNDGALSFEIDNLLFWFDVLAPKDTDTKGYQWEMVNNNTSRILVNFRPACVYRIYRRILDIIRNPEKYQGDQPELED